MSEEKNRVITTASELMQVIDKQPLSVIEVILTLAVLNSELLNRYMEAARKAGDEALIRVIRKAMHALPNGLTQFLNAWQPSKSKEAISTMCDVIADKFSQAEREAGDIDRGRKALYRRY